MDRDKILIIDDSAVQAEFLKSILKEEYEVTTCQTATEGLKQAQSGEYSLILLDVVMPDMDGFTLLRELKSAFQTRHIPVIMLTSLSDVHNEEKGLLLGAVDYVAKPFSPIIIRARVKTHIDLYHFQMQFMEQALVDELTGIPNRRRYESDSVMNWRKAIRFGCPFSVCMIDIDQFKLYNDSFGHPAGDKVIASVAQVIASHLRRATDFFARYGGEEFVVIQVGETAQNAYNFLKVIRQAVEDLHIPHSSPDREWVTISAGGVTVTPKSEDSYETYLKIADTMLYDAKRLGRNRVIWSSGSEQWKEKE
ncbi:MAG: diguanylate cyclase [Lawsonibacter sp.]|nr:diguanylate cyclase [Lawsonibacter sp.]